MPSNSHHQSKPQSAERPQHVVGDSRRRIRAIDAGRQAGNDHVVFVNSAQHIVIGIEFILTRDWLMPLIQCGDCRRHLMT
jgi:hypothetical protein